MYSWTPFINYNINFFSKEPRAGAQLQTLQAYFIRLIILDIWSHLVLYGYNKIPVTADKVAREIDLNYKDSLY